jgi:hypothetical protein
MLRHEEERRDHVGDVHDRECVLSRNGVQRDRARRQTEDAQEVAVARTVHCRGAHDADRQRLLVRARRLLRFQLALTVSLDRRRRVVLAHRTILGRGGARGRLRRDQYDARRRASAAGRCGGEHVSRRHDVSAPELRERAPLRHAGKVEHVSRSLPGRCLADGLRVEQVDHAALHARIERVRGRAFANERANLCATREQRVDEVRSDESGRAGDDGDHE